MRLREISSPVNKIIAVAMTLKNRDEKDDIQTKITMDAFLKMLKNSGVTIDYEGFKKVFDTNPQLKNIIDKFDSDSITLKAGDITDKDAKGFEPPATDIPADERVSKMARKAMRTREDLDRIKLLAGLSESEHSDKAGQIAADSVRGSKFSDKDDLESALLNALPNFPDKDYDRSKAIERAMEILDSEIDDMLSEREVTNEDPVTVTVNGKTMDISHLSGKTPYDKTQSFNKIFAKNYSKHNTKAPNYTFHHKGKQIGQVQNTGNIHYKDPTTKELDAMAKSHNKLFKQNEEIANNELDERELTKAEKSKMKSYEKKIDKKDFVDRYGKKKGEPYYYATITKMAKKHA